MNMKSFIRSNIRLSRLLNALDDVASPECCVFAIATTNISKARQTLIQPKSIEFKPLTREISAEQTREVFLMLYTEKSAFTDKRKEDLPLLAHVQQCIQSPSDDAFKSFGLLAHDTYSYINEPDERVSGRRENS